MAAKASIIEVNPAEIDDFSTILDLDESVCGSRTRGRWIAESILAGQCYKAAISGRTAGFIIFNYSFYENGFVALLIVDPSTRRMGMGKRLMEYVEQICRTNKLFTSTNESNLPMQGLLESCGYVKSGFIDNLDEGDPELVYYKKLRK